MPIFRIVYIDSNCIDDASAGLRTLTAAFANRATAEAAMAKHGHRIAYLVEMAQGESPRDPVTVSMVRGFTGGRARSREAARAAAAHSILGVARYDFAAMAVVVAGAVMTGAAIWLF